MRNCPNSPSLRSPAKINLGLRLVGRRPDGYHLIESLFWPLDFADKIVISESPNICVEAVWGATAPRRNEAIPQQRENLVYRAMEKAVGGAAKFKIQITKHIPIGAGLGGGSSNAGTLLKHLAETGQIQGECAEKTALALGADVPFFLTPYPAWVEGIGEKRTPLQVSPDVLKNLSFLLVIPPRSSPTPILFSQYRALQMPLARQNSVPMNGGFDWPNLKAYLALAENSLQGTAIVQYPLLAEILGRLKKVSSLYSGLSGTGSTCFAVFRDFTQAVETAKDLQPFCRKSGCESLTAKTHNRPA